MLFKTQLRKHRTLIQVIFIAFITGAVSLSYGANYYVDNAANGSNNGTSWANAWESFADIYWANVQPGDTVYISGGTTSKVYYETLVVGASGTNGAPVTITKGVDAGHNGQVIINQEYIRDRAIYANGYDYVIVSHLSTRNSVGNGAILIKYANHFIVEYCNVEMRYRGIFYEFNSDCTARYNTVISEFKNRCRWNEVYYSL